jgi:hypothetical protein
VTAKGFDGNLFPPFDSRPEQIFRDNRDDSCLAFPRHGEFPFCPGGITGIEKFPQSHRMGLPARDPLSVYRAKYVAIAEAGSISGTVRMDVSNDFIVGLTLRKKFDADAIMLKRRRGIFEASRPSETGRAVDNEVESLERGQTKRDDLLVIHRLP